MYETNYLDQWSTLCFWSYVVVSLTGSAMLIIHVRIILQPYRTWPLPRDFPRDLIDDAERTSAFFFWIMQGPKKYANSLPRYRPENHYELLSHCLPS